MTPPAPLRLQRVLGGDHLAALRQRLRRRFERAPLEGAVEDIRIDKLTAEEYAALASLLGRAQRYSRSLHIDLRRVDATLQQAGIATSLCDALAQLDGPIRHLATARRQILTLWSGVLGRCRDPGLAELLATMAGIGLLKRLSKQQPEAAAELCGRAEAVLQKLPAAGITRSRLAADILGDAHALDQGQPTATLVLAVRRHIARPGADKDDAASAEPAAEDDRPANGAVERDRDVWSAAGVLVNELARPALFLNLPMRTTDSEFRLRGEPAYASLRALLRRPPAWDVAERIIYVCENPNLVAIAADHWGPGCAPLVCTDGMPAAAQRCLLSQLAEARADLRYHGDFDWPGLRIGNHVMREHKARPWRFGAADYAAAIRTAPSLGQALIGKVVEAQWDDALAPAMQQYRTAIAEEALADSLLQDLDDR